MMQTKGFAEYIPVANCEWMARLIDAYNKMLKNKELRIK
jgi:hypothetical protein